MLPRLTVLLLLVLCAAPLESCPNGTVTYVANNCSYAVEPTQLYYAGTASEVRHAACMHSLLQGQCSTRPKKDLAAGV